MARRYHWLSNNLSNYIIEPHRGIIGNERIPFCSDMTSRESEENRKTCIDIIKGGSNLIKSSIYKIMETNNYSQNLDKWIYNNKLPLDSHGFFEKSDINIEKYEIPRRINWNVMDELYDIYPKNYEEIISQEGVGPSTIRCE